MNLLQKINDLLSWIKWQLWDKSQDIQSEGCEHDWRSFFDSKLDDPLYTTCKKCGKIR
jgi:hypothetical protein